MKWNSGDMQVYCQGPAQSCLPLHLGGGSPEGSFSGVSSTTVSSCIIKPLFRVNFLIGVEGAAD